ncbi:zinc finger MYND domain-containing protein 10 [Chelonus insularis]|uniref:zinc finger MYND domain-containing protein 10 n=1 Tax=Chelonus insularis TaxID=460826 RepID=UPI00158D2EA7|nr:zinc finger MYND domain-containing protein 10 [Chelonus insularis]
MSEEYEYILQPWEIESYIENLEISDLEDIGKTSWFEYHKKLMHLNQQSILDISHMHDEAVKEWFVTFQKIPILIHEAIQISIWKQKIFPYLIESNKELSNTFMIYSILYHENIAVSLMENILFHSDSIESMDDSTLDLIDYAVSYLTSIIFPKTKTNVQRPDNSWTTEILIKKDEIEFDISIKCIAIIGYLATRSDNLPLAFLKRLLSTHDVPYLFTQLIEKKPWIKVINGERMIYTSKWDRVTKGEEDKISKIEGQIWICLRGLLLNPKCAPYYQITQFRISELTKLQKYLHEKVLDQISPLIDLRRWLSYLNISSQPSETKPTICVELIPQIQATILEKYKKQWKKLADTQLQLFHSKDMNYVKETAQVLSDAYDVDKIIFEEKDKCALCKEVASKRCSKCKSVWYCGRACQVKDWNTHKKICEQLVKKMGDAEK